MISPDPESGRVPEPCRVDRRWLLGLMAIALAAALARALQWDHLVGIWSEGGEPAGDAKSLDIWAVNILEGAGFKMRLGYQLYEAFRMPFFSVFLAAVYAIGGIKLGAAHLALAALSVLIPLGVAGIGRLLWDRKAGFLAGMICAVYQPLTIYAAALMTESLFTLLFVLGVYLFLRSVRERDWPFAAGAGLAMGLAGLTRVVAFAAVPAMAIYLATSPEGRGRKARLALVWLAAMVVSFSPWVVRNRLVLGGFLLSESGGTRQIWTGANPAYAPQTYIRKAWYDILWRDPGASEMEQNRRLMREARAMILARPARYAGWMAWRAKTYLALPSLRDILRDFGPDDCPDLLVWGTARLGYAGFALALFLRFRSFIMTGGLFLSLLMLHAVAGEHPRYRLTGEWLWILGAAFVLSALADLIRGRRPASGRDRAVPWSLFDRRGARLAALVALVLPVLVLSGTVLANRRRLAAEAVPTLREPVEAAVTRAGLREEFARQEGRLLPLDAYRRMAFSQAPGPVRYPRDVVVWGGELSHFVLGRNGRIRSFTFQVDKHDLSPGSARISPTAVAGNLRRPPGTRRLKGVVIGLITGTGGLGEPFLEVRDIVTAGGSLAVKDGPGARRRRRTTAPSAGPPEGAP